MRKDSNYVSWVILLLIIGFGFTIPFIVLAVKAAIVILVARWGRLMWKVIKKNRLWFSYPE